LIYAYYFRIERRDKKRRKASPTYKKYKKNINVTFGASVISGAKKGIKTSDQIYKRIMLDGPLAIQMLLVKIIAQFTRYILKKALTKRKLPTRKHFAKAV
jgi:hypothetical protein